MSLAIQNDHDKSVKCLIQVDISDVARNKCVTRATVQGFPNRLNITASISHISIVSAQHKLYETDSTFNISEVTDSYYIKLKY